MLGDRAAQPDDRHLLDPVATPKPRSGRRGTRAVRGIDVDILLRDAAGRAAARHELQFDAEIPGAPPHRRRRQRLLPNWTHCGLSAQALSRFGPLSLATLSRNAGEGNYRRSAITVFCGTWPDCRRFLLLTHPRLR